MSALAIIGGSGLYEIDGGKLVKEHELETPYGRPSDKILEVEFSKNTVFFLPRHGKGHTLNPSEINYRANIYALKSLGVRFIVSVSAVGSLKEEYHPNHVVLPSQFMDWTKSKRPRTFFEDGIVGHVSNANPVFTPLRNIVAESLKACDIVHTLAGTYICIEGPQFSTRAESSYYRQMGMDIVGMTNVPEAFLAKEAAIGYTTMAMVTDYDAWKDEHCTVEEIMKVMAVNKVNAKKVLMDFIPRFYDSKLDYIKENEFSIISAQEGLSAEKKSIIETLLR